MSSLYIAAALVGTFAAVVTAGLAAHAIAGDRRRALQLLQSQVGEVMDLRQHELAQPFLDRVIVPVTGALGRMARRMTPVGMRDRIARLLVLGGHSGNLNPEKVAAAKVFGAIGGGLVGFLLATLAGLKGLLPLGATAFAGLFAYLIPGAGLGQKAVQRQKAIQRALPDVMDLLTISVEAGLGFDAALANVRSNVPGPLSEEIGRMLQEMQLGVPRVEAFRHLGERTDVDELRAFILAMVQADQFGISIAKVLRSQAHDLRIRRRQRAEEQAIKVPVKLLFPLIVGFMPSLFLVVAGPGVIQIARVFLKRPLF
jgi:tight adherence protein C